MGMYLQTPEMLDKALQLQEMYGAWPCDPEWPPPEGKTLICVVENPAYDAAGIIYDKGEFYSFLEPDIRPRTWLLMDTTKVRALNQQYNTWISTQTPAA